MRYAGADEQGISAVQARDIRTHPEERSVRVRAKGLLAELDADHDGFINETELLKHVVSASAEHKERVFLKRAVIAMSLLLLLFAFVGMGLTYAVIETTKETRTSDNDILISVHSGDPVQCASSDFVVINGALVPRDAETESTLRRLQTTDNYLDADSVAALATRQAMQKRELASTMPDSYFKELQWLEIQTEIGATLSLRITTISRVMHSKAKCGTFLKLVTSAGVLILDDVDIYYDDEVAGLLSEAGFVRFIKQSPAVASSRIPATRKLSSMIYLEDVHVPHLRMVHDAPVRLLMSEGSLMVIGFFNFIDTVPWTCSSVERPDMPEVYSAEILVLQKCDVIPDVGDDCKYHQHRFETDMYGVAIVDGTRFVSSIQKIYRTASMTAVTVEYPYHPNVTEVLLHFPESKLARSFQVEPDRKVSHCYTSTMDTPIMKLPDDYIFAYVGRVDNTNLRHFQISYKTDGPQNSTNYETIDYYDDAVTKFPALIIQADGSLVDIKDLRAGDAALKFQDANYSVTTSDFQNCMIATEAAADPVRVAELRNLSSSSADEDDSEHVELVAALQAWNWSVQYPPSVGSVRSFSSDDLQYYVDLLVPTAPDPDDERSIIYVANSDWANWALQTMNASKLFLISITKSNNQTRLSPGSKVGFPGASSDFGVANWEAEDITNTWTYIWENELDAVGKPLVKSGFLSYYFNVNPIRDTMIFAASAKPFKISFFFGWKDDIKLYFKLEGCYKVFCGGGKISGTVDVDYNGQGKDDNKIAGEVEIYMDAFQVFGPVGYIFIPTVVRRMVSLDLASMRYEYRPGEAGKINGDRVRRVHTIGGSASPVDLLSVRVRVTNRFRSYDARQKGQWGNRYGDFSMIASVQVRKPKFFSFSWRTVGSWELIDDEWKY